MKHLLLLSACALAYSAESCPTVTVKGQDGNALLINQSDYDAAPDAWELFTDEAAPAADLPPVVAPVASEATPVATPVQMLVTKEGRGQSARYFVTTADKSKVSGVAGIEESGYDDEGAAWAAIMAVSTGTAS